ncbi:hypothetical protein OIU85_011413 [Salix viminalis]|uniref:Uncharacterized protein n=1 Tax=Salix viminalis TaxID=40686 RepID=A0A9Q0NSR2_SALVM|nr:hypothetical protein OIU85_011413 [Salix viminalis]
MNLIGLDSKKKKEENNHPFARFKLKISIKTFPQQGELKRASTLITQYTEDERELWDPILHASSTKLVIQREKTALYHSGGPRVVMWGLERDTAPVSMQINQKKLSMKSFPAQSDSLMPLLSLLPLPGQLSDIALSADTRC